MYSLLTNTCTIQGVVAKRMAWVDIRTQSQDDSKSCTISGIPT